MKQSRERRGSIERRDSFDEYRRGHEAHRGSRGEKEHKRHAGHGGHKSHGGHKKSQGASGGGKWIVAYYGLTTMGMYQYIYCTIFTHGRDLPQPQPHCHSIFTAEIQAEHGISSTVIGHP